MNLSNKMDRRALLLSGELFILIAAYYQVKPLSRTLIITEMGSAVVPYGWVAASLVLILLLPYLRWRAKSYTTTAVHGASCLSFAVLLILYWSESFGTVEKMSLPFFIVVDIYGVVLLENFWSQVNWELGCAQGRKMFGIVATGGLLGGVFGSVAANGLLRIYGFVPTDLLLVACGLLSLPAGLAISGQRRFISKRLMQANHPQFTSQRNHLVVPQTLRRYFMLLSVIVLAGQCVEPIIEYQFLHAVEQATPDLTERTLYLTQVLALVSTLALLLNIIVAPRISSSTLFYYLAIQPSLLMVVAIFSLVSPALGAYSILKIVDRGTSYSIGKVLREYLYVDLATQTMRVVRVLLDIVGYRSFKVLGSLLVILGANRFADASSVLTVILISLTAFWLVAVLQFAPRPLGTISRLHSRENPNSVQCSLIRRYKSASSQILIVMSRIIQP
ncbi:MAG: hypothetical protein KDD42_07355 [Bdellovibrionales bacterium]|nr:hypothetical protein [Bdellovibrionales bacterium]